MEERKMTNSKLKNNNKNTFEAHNMQTYLYGIMAEDMRLFAESGNKKTGYANLDAITNLYPGLYVLGAISSLGKTTFAHQMADQIAESGEPVIYFSLEQGVLELASKSLSRIMAKKDKTTAVSSLQIRKNEIDKNVADAMTAYASFAGNLTVVECGFEATIDDIEQYVNDYIRINHNNPVVFIDYLQVIRVSDLGMSTKDAVEMHVKRLKQLQKDNNLVVIVISSLNRQNYLSPVDFESFKESGGIEYTADVLWGLQLEVLQNEVFSKRDQTAEKRRLVREAKAAEVREIELCCLKNRFGKSSYSCKFAYYPQFDCFVPDMSGTDKRGSRNEA